MWTPRPCSQYVFPPDVRSFVVPTPDGDLSFDAEVMGMVESVYPQGDLGLQVRCAIDAVDRSVTHALLRAGRVADAVDHRLTVEVRAHLLTWPAVPGITAPGSAWPGI